MSDKLVLENDLMRLKLTPQCGGNVLGFSINKDGKWLDVIPDCEAPDCELQWSSWLMIPYSNRIKDGKFTFEGKEYTLQDGENHAIHGDTRTRPWKVEEQSAEHVAMRFVSTEHDNVNWPWAFEALAEYSFCGNVFSSSLSLWNRDTTAMPAGFGWHPYFNRSLTKKGEEVRMRMKIDGAYPTGEENPGIPTGPMQKIDPRMDFSEEKPVPTDLRFDYCACGYDQGGWIVWPESGVKLTFDCSDEMDHIVLYNPIEDPNFAAEPVTNSNNGVNLANEGDEHAGVVVLQPGDCLSGRFDIQLEVS